MNIKKVINAVIIILCFFLVTGTGVFILNSTKGYTLNNYFVSVPLQFNPDNSSSSYKLRKTQITVYGGFIKGLQKQKKGNESIVIRALSPLPVITVKGDSPDTISVLLENINPEFYLKRIGDNKKKSMKITTVNTLQFNLVVNPKKAIKINPQQPSAKDNTQIYKYIIMGDSRDGYHTFKKIIQQINGENPVFVINNGDLVYSGKSNQYRLFNQIVSKNPTPIYTTLGNHDIRGNGRSTYTMLYGPAYYSFDFADSHFVFLDSSPGWVEKQAISDKQYIWLERDLKKAQGKRIFVITHIPPHDPRSGTTPNEIPNYVKSNQNWLEQKLNKYFETKNINHGFRNPHETEKFEKLMSLYHVDTVFSSHIHSYLEYNKDGVRYLITGGAGAELLTENSYYHYIIMNVGKPNTVTVKELPSPANNYLARQLAAIQLYSTAMYEENQLAVILLIIGFSILFILLFVLIIAKIYLWSKHPRNAIWKWWSKIWKYAIKLFK